MIRTLELPVGAPTKSSWNDQESQALNRLAEEASVQLGYNGLERKLPRQISNDLRRALRQGNEYADVPFLAESVQNKDLSALLRKLEISAIPITRADLYKRSTLEQKRRECGFLGNHIWLRDRLFLLLWLAALFVIFAVIAAFSAPAVTTKGRVLTTMLGCLILWFLDSLARIVVNIKDAREWQWETIGLRRYPEYDVPPQAICKALLIRKYVRDACFFVDRLVFGKTSADPLLKVKHGEQTAYIEVWGGERGLEAELIDQA